MNKDSTMLAYHGDPKLKAATIAEMKAHREADRLFLDALCAGVVAADLERGAITGTRWRAGQARGTLNTRGYVVFTLHWNGQRAQIKAHRAIWLAAHGPIPEGLIPDHVNRDRADNRLANLRLVTDQENAQNRRSYRGEGNPAARLTQRDVENIRTAGCQRGSRAQLAEQYGVSTSLINKIVQGRVWA